MTVGNRRLLVVVRELQPGGVEPAQTQVIGKALHAGGEGCEGVGLGVSIILYSCLYGQNRLIFRWVCSGDDLKCYVYNFTADGFESTWP